jgi:hypothetical protein
VRRGEVFLEDLLAPRREDEGTLHLVAKLAQVAGPSVSLHRAQRFGGETRSARSRDERAGLVEKVLRQDREVAASIREARERELDASDPPEEIFAERARVAHRVEILVRRGDEPDVHVDGFARPDREDLARFEGTEQLHLELELEIADLVEEERAAVGFDEEARRVGDGAGEGSALVSEERRLEQRRCERPAVDGDERARAPTALGVDVPSEDLFPGARRPA